MARSVENQHFDVCPRIVRADAETAITITPLADSGLFRDGGDYAVTVYPMEKLAGKGAAQAQAFCIRPTDGALRVGGRFAGEQEHALFVERVSNGKKTPVGEFSVYSLEEDLFRRRPFKGDFHVHSDRSDGREPPAYVAGACRRIGLDFMAVTDHRKYEPSLEAQRAFEDVEIDLRIYPGEEIHHQHADDPVHIVNFGGRFSVNALIGEQQTYLAEVEAIEASITDPALTGERRTNYAQCLWTYGKIREAGGLAIFCHPYWVTAHAYNVPESLIARHFAEQPFDAYELIGGYKRHQVESNLLQVARYHEERARGRRIPIIGVSDAHGCERGELFGWYYTIVFSPSAELPALAENIAQLYSVAVEALPGEAPRAHGPFRLVKYAQFLLREVFPAHDALCLEEGRLMLAHLAGDPEAAAGLRARRGSTAALYARYWGEGTIP
jgi:predicted metal-dependent phosphoesterase TrpH